jgi:putative transposase
MKKRFTEEQIIRVLQEAEGAENVRDVCRKHNVTEQTFYRWRNKYEDSFPSILRITLSSATR